MGSGVRHETALYGSDEEFLAIVVPFLERGVQQGEPTLVGLTAPTTQLLRDTVGDVPGVVFLDDTDGARSRPAGLIRANREAFAAQVAAGARRIRVLGEVPHPGLGVPWGWWARYEAAVNHVYDDFPVWGICPYDTRTTPPDVLADVLRTHPHLTGAGGRSRSSPDYEDPRAFLVRRQSADGDRPKSASLPETAVTPAVDVLDPPLPVTRELVRSAGQDARLTEAEIDDLVLVVSEGVSNAVAHGRPPVRVRFWTALRRVVALISDTGAGPADPFAGLLPARGSATGGFGLWIAHQLCSDVTLRRTDRGFTLRLVWAGPESEEHGRA